MPDQLLPAKRYITSGAAVPPSRAQISHAVVVNNTCYVGGQLSVGASGSYQRGDIKQEAKQAFNNLFAVLRAAGFAQDDIVYLELAFDNLGDLPVVSELYNQMFREESRPCRIVNEVSGLPYDALFRVNGVAVKGSNNHNFSGGS